MGQILLNWSLRSTSQMYRALFVSSHWNHVETPVMLCAKKQHGTSLQRSFRNALLAVVAMRGAVWEAGVGGER